MLNERERAGLEQGRAEGESIGLKKGESIGLQKGHSEGAAQEKRGIAKAMKEKSMPIAVIADVTGLTAEEIEAL